MTAVLDSGRILVEQFVDEELGNSSYVVVDREAGVAAVVDAPRDADRFLALAEARGWRIVAALDTHVHNDFVSGGPDLRAAVGASHLVPAGSGIARADRHLAEGEDVAIGSLRLRALHTPGHTPEHLSYAVSDGGGPVIALLSGGALMVGTMARPDLLGPSHTFQLARRGRATMRRLMESLADDLLVLPTHGGGSFCGASSSGERITTIGRERASNPLATAPDFAHFLAVHAKQGEYPAYYARMAPANRAARTGLAGEPPHLREIAAEELADALAAGAAVVDCRVHAAFDEAHVPGSISVPLHGPFSPWVGWVVDIDTPVVLVADSSDDAEEATRQLVRIGFSGVGRWMPFAGWPATGRPVRSVRRGSMADLAEQILDGAHLSVVDVRQEREWAAGHLPGAVHALPSEMGAIAGELDRDAPVAVHCETGHRSAVAVSLLLLAGVTGVWHIADGTEEWKQLGHPLVTPE